MMGETEEDVFDGEDMLSEPLLQRSESLPTDWDGFEPFEPGKEHAVVPVLEEHRKNVTEDDWKSFARAELRTVGRMALPVAGMNFVWLMRTIVSTIFLGQLGRLSLAGGSLAVSIANVTGYSVITGLCYALEPLMSQAYGAKQFHEVGYQLQRGMTILLFCTLPIVAMWCYMEPILILLGQDHAVAKMAGIYIVHLIPDAFIICLVMPLRIYLTAQGITVPMFICALIAAAVHIPLNVLFISTLGWGPVGAAAATWISDLILLVLLLAFIVSSGVYKQSWGGFSLRQCFREWGPFLALAVPSCFSVCLEWWCYEALLLAAGLLENPELAVSTMAITENITTLLFMLPGSLGNAVSVRIGVELGSNKARAAHMAAQVGVGLGFALGLLITLFLILLRWPLASCFTSDPQLLALVGGAIVINAISLLGDAPQAVMQGILRGSARPGTAAKINVGGYYLVGLPAALALAFWGHFGVYGLQWGIVCAQVMQVLLMGTVVWRTDWDAEAGRAQASNGVLTLEGKVPEKQRTNVMTIARKGALAFDEDGLVPIARSMDSYFHISSSYS